MKITILGSGGATELPKPCCQCNVCRQAREKGAPYQRRSSAIYVHGIDALIDAPEDISESLNSADIKEVKRLFITHWHPDHTFGLRFVEMNMDWRADKVVDTVDVYLARNTFDQLRSVFPIEYFLKKKLININFLESGEFVKFGRIKLISIGFQMNYPNNGFLIEENSKKVGYFPCDTFYLRNLNRLKNLDVLIHETGWWEKDIHGRVAVSAKCGLRKCEIQHEKVLLRIKKLKPRRTILTHIEESDGRSYDYFRKLQRSADYIADRITFAYDGMEIEV